MSRNFLIPCGSSHVRRACVKYATKTVSMPGTLSRLIRDSCLKLLETFSSVSGSTIFKCAFHVCAGKALSVEVGPLPLAILFKVQSSVMPVVRRASRISNTIEPGFSGSK